MSRTAGGSGTITLSASLAKIIVSQGITFVFGDTVKINAVGLETITESLSVTTDDDVTHTGFAALAAMYVDGVDLTDATTVTLSLAQALDLAASVSAGLTLTGATGKIIIVDTQANFNATPGLITGFIPDDIGALADALNAGTIKIKALPATTGGVTPTEVGI
ncbi:MAG: hypothetical protein FD149_818 [Rhodospirillaceae bacterium]|nr:MAG: hypothetical protein FD149_818 [Rhodospirillaceae bacterium]